MKYATFYMVLHQYQAVENGCKRLPGMLCHRRV